jgi:hypothetical protein
MHSTPAITEFGENAFCEYCREVFTLDYGRYRVKTVRIPYERCDKYPDFPTLGATAAAGCSPCSALLRGFKLRFASKSSGDWNGWFKMQEIDVHLEPYHVDGLDAQNALSVQEKGPFQFRVAYSVRMNDSEFDRWDWLDLDVYAEQGEQYNQGKISQLPNDIERKRCFYQGQDSTKASGAGGIVRFQRESCESSYSELHAAPFGMRAPETGRASLEAPSPRSGQ